jgi:hypothetical protein
MAGRWVMVVVIATVALSVSAAWAVGNLQAPGLLNAAHVVSPLSEEDPAPTDGEDPAATDTEETLNRAQQAISSAVGIPDTIRQRLMGQVGGLLQSGAGKPSTVGLDLAALMTANAHTIDNRPTEVPGLANAATHISEQAQAALSLVPNQWIRDRLNIGTESTDTTQPTE